MTQFSTQDQILINNAFYLAQCEILEKPYLFPCTNLRAELIKVLQQWYKDEPNQPISPDILADATLEILVDRHNIDLDQSTEQANRDLILTALWGVPNELDGLSQ